MKIQKGNLDYKFYFNTVIINKDINLTFYKAINGKGKFVWIEKSGLLKAKENESFYLMILSCLKNISFERMIALSFNLFMSRQDFYSQYTFVKNIKHNEK